MGSDGAAVKDSWVIAVVIALAANTLSSFGLNLQKLALTYRGSGVRQRVYVAVWISGFVCIVGGAFCDFAALGFGAQSIVAPLGSWALVSNSVIAPFFLGETITRRDLVATFLIVAGCSISVAMASHEDAIYTLEQLFDLYRRPSFGIYLGLIVAIIIAVMITVRHVERLEARHGKSSRQYTRWATFHRLSYSAVAGIAGAQSVLFAKTIVEALTGTIVNHERVFLADWRTYPVMAGMACTLTLQVYWMQCGLARWDAVYCVPIFYVFWILLGVVGGGVLYNEFSAFSLAQTIVFPLGILMCVVGVYYLSKRDVETETARRAASGAGGAEMDVSSVVGVGEEVENATGTASATVDKGTAAIAIGLPGAKRHSLGGLSAPGPGDSTRSLLQGNAGVGGDRLTREEEAALAHRLAALEHRVTFTDAYLGLGLRRTVIKVVSAPDPRNHRMAAAWAVSSLPKRQDGSPGPAEASGQVEVGDILVAVNGESMLNPWMTHTDAMRRLSYLARPITITFHRAPVDAHRVRWLASQMRAHAPAPVPGGGMEGGGTPLHATRGKRMSASGRLPLTALQHMPHDVVSDAESSAETAVVELPTAGTMAVVATATGTSEAGDQVSAHPPPAFAPFAFPQPVRERFLSYQRRDDVGGVGGASRRRAGSLFGASTRHRAAPSRVPDTPLDMLEAASPREGEELLRRTAAMGLRLDAHLTQEHFPLGTSASDAADSGTAAPSTSASPPPGAATAMAARGDGGGRLLDSVPIFSPGLTLPASNGAAAAAGTRVGLEVQGVSGAGEDGVWPPDQDYEVEVLVADSDTATSAGASITHAHSHLRGITLDPLSGLFHMGSLIGPSAMEEAYRGGSHQSHPLAKLMLRIFPHEPSTWNGVDRFLDGIDRLTAAGTGGVPRESMAGGGGWSTMPTAAQRGDAGASEHTPLRSGVHSASGRRRSLDDGMGPASSTVVVGLSHPDRGRLALGGTGESAYDAL